MWQWDSVNSELHIHIFLGQWNIVRFLKRFRMWMIRCKKFEPFMWCFSQVTKFIGKHLCYRIFFNKFAGLRPTTLLKKETLVQVFSCEFTKFLRTPFFNRTPPVVASEKKRLQQRCFTANFEKILTKPF